MVVMVTDFGSSVHIDGRRADLIKLDVPRRLGEPPKDLASTFVVELTEGGSVIRKEPSELGAILRWLRGDTETATFCRQLDGQESELAKLVAWLNGLVPAVGESAGTASAIFGVDRQEFTPEVSGTSFYCCGYVLDLWYGDMESVAKKLHIDLTTGHVSVVRVWQLRDD